MPNLLSSQLLLASITRTNSGLLNVQSQFATGNIINRFSDDSIGAVTVSTLQERLARTEQRLRNLSNAQGTLDYLDSSIGDASELVLEAKNIASDQIGAQSDTVTRNNALVKTEYQYRDDLVNGHFGVTYDIRPDANVYFGYSTASDINGGESDVGTSGAYGGLAISPDGQFSGAPGETESFEFGTKWNLFDRKLLATAAIFRIDKDEVFETAITNPGDPNRYANLGTLNTGASRINGLELGLAGNLTPRLSVQGGVAWMDARIQESNVPTRIGKTLSNFADLTGSFQLRFQATEKIALGGAMKYESEKYAGPPDTAPSFDALNRYTQPLPAYAVGDLFADYTINKHANVRLNVGNITDEDYFLTGYQSGAFLYKGDARNLRVTLNYDF
mgnify:CR=1 FL=1